jgi:hypothetical protein
LVQRRHAILALKFDRLPRRAMTMTRQKKTNALIFMALFLLPIRGASQRLND